jgi:hypothetical protein
MKNVHLAMLGVHVKDRVTGFTGVVTSVCFDLYGCIQATVHPGLDAQAKMGESLWFDVNRLQLADGGRVMPVPDYESQSVANGDKGPAEKPRFSKA